MSSSFTANIYADFHKKTIISIVRSALTLRKLEERIPLSRFLSKALRYYFINGGTNGTMPSLLSTVFLHIELALGNE